MKDGQLFLKILRWIILRRHSSLAITEPGCEAARENHWIISRRTIVFPSLQMEADTAAGAERQTNQTPKHPNGQDDSKVLLKITTSPVN
jgi:hypothetical protein